MRRLLTIMLACCLVLGISLPTLAEPVQEVAFKVGSKVYKLNNRENTMDAVPFVENGRTYVPVRYLAYSCGLTDQDVKYDQVFQTVSLTKGNVSLQLQVGIDQFINDGKVVELDVPPVMINGRTYLPARWVAEAFGYKVAWVEQSRSVIIKSASNT